MRGHAARIGEHETPTESPHLRSPAITTPQIPAPWTHLPDPTKLPKPNGKSKE
jgi:hypothetical protein